MTSRPPPPPRPPSRPPPAPAPASTRAATPLSQRAPRPSTPPLPLVPLAGIRDATNALSSSGAPGDSTRAGPPRSSKSGRPERDASVLVGEVISGRYRIERLLGEGGMGAVYQAEHTHMRKRLAVKILHADMSRLPEVVARFEREAMAAAHIDHPNVAAATDFGKLTDGSFFLVLEYVEGRSLRRAIDHDGPFVPARALGVVKQIAMALERAHALGIVHRDLKPENVMLVDRPSEPDFVKVLDFGIAKVPIGDFSPRETSETGSPIKLTKAGMVYGTPEYMAPEQALGQEVDARADLYALGVIAFELLSGVRPYEAESKVALLGMQVTAPIPFIADRAPGVTVPPAVESLVRRLLAKESRERTGSATELVMEIDAMLADLARAHGPTGPPEAMQSQPPGAHRGIRDKRDKRDSGAPAMTGQLPLGADAIKTEQFAVGAGPLGQLAPPESASRARSVNRWQGQRVVAGACAAAIAVVVGAGLAFRAFHLHQAEITPVDTAAIDAGALAVHDPSASDAATGSAGSAVDAAVDPALTAGLRAQEKAAAAKHKWTEVIETTRSIIQLDPSAVNEDALLGDVRNAALDPAHLEAGMGLIVTMGSRGGDVLYDIAYSPWSMHGAFAKARARANQLLHTPEMRNHVSPALDITLTLRDGAPCDAKPALDRASTDGDFRTNYVLRPWASTKGCGAGKTHAGDCYACLHGDDALTKTIAAIDARSPDPNRPH